MNCRHAERLWSRGKDYNLSEREQTLLQQHLADCSACRYREETYQKLVTAVRAQTATPLTVDLLARARQEASHTATRPTPRSKFRGTLFRGALAAVALGGAGLLLVPTRLPPAYGQAAIKKMQAAAAKVSSLHFVTWEFTMTEEEARNHTWHEGKKPIRTDTWVIPGAMRGWDPWNGPYLLTSRGYLAYDQDTKRVGYQNLGPTFSPQKELQKAMDPLSLLKSTAPPGAYLSVKRLEKTDYKGQRVYKIQVTSGPEKPSPAELISAPEPGSTPPIRDMPRIRQTFWVDETTNLPVYSEYEKEIQHKWALLRRTEYEYNRPTPPRLFDPEAIRKAAAAHMASRKKQP